MAKELVLMDHDGGVDDFLSLAMVLNMPHVELIGVVVTPADCYIQPAMSVSAKVIDLAGRTGVPLAESTVRPINPFPSHWRQTAFIIDHFPVLNDKPVKTQPLAQNGQTFMVEALRGASAPVTLLVTGPLTTVAAALEIAPDIEAKISRIVWMGGALNVAGNVDIMMEPGQDGSAEWNVFWDPVSAHAIWQTKIPIVLCPLDITNNVPVTGEVIRYLASHRKHPLCELAAYAYAVVMREHGYFFWDMLTTGFIGKPDLYTLRDWRTVVIPDGPSQGRTKVDDSGRVIQVMDTVDKPAFYQYVVDCLS